MLSPVFLSVYICAAAFIDSFLLFPSIYCGLFARHIQVRFRRSICNRLSFWEMSLLPVKLSTYFYIDSAFRFLPVATCDSFCQTLVGAESSFRQGAFPCSAFLLRLDFSASPVTGGEFLLRRPPKSLLRARRRLIPSSAMADRAIGFPHFPQSLDYCKPPVRRLERLL